MTMPVLGTCLGLNRRKDDQERRNDKERLLHRLLHEKLMVRNYKRGSNSAPRGLFLHGCHLAPLGSETSCGKWQAHFTKWKCATRNTPCYGPTTVTQACP
jgi:hypothetical protein